MPRNPKTGDLMTDSELKELNRQRFMQGVAEGNLYNTGPITQEGGTSFAKDRWKAYFDENPDEAPSDWTGDSESYIVQIAETDGQEFVVDRNDIDIRDEQDLEPSYPSRGKDKSFLTVDQAKAELAKEQSDISKEAEAEIETQAPVEAEADSIDVNDAPMSVWVEEFSSMSDEDFAAHEAAIGQLPKAAQEAYAAVAETKGNIEYEDALGRAGDANQDKIDELTSQASSVSEARDELNTKIQDTKDRIVSQIDDALIELNYQKEIKDIDDFYDGVTEKRGMLTTNVTELGKGSGEAQADALLRDQAKDREISDMKDKDREITTTIMKDTGLDVNQANALMGKLKGLCG